MTLVKPQEWTVPSQASMPEPQEWTESTSRTEPTSQKTMLTWKPMLIRSKPSSTIIADLDIDYGSELPESDIELDNQTHPIEANEIDKLNSDAAREQTSADQDADGHDDTDDKSTDDDDDVPLPRLRRKRAPSYKHLKGRDGDGLLPTVAWPREFRGNKHQAHVMLQNIVMTQYNLKQGIKKFGDVGKAAVLVELRQLYDPNVMSPINKYDLTAAERKGALRNLMFF
jgi:hypothetical protein